MTKICVFGDIHGNITQLKKLIKTKDFKDADYKICLGDTVGLGPYPKKCLKLLNKHKVIHLLGNHEARLVKLINDLNVVEHPEAFKQFEINRKKLGQWIEEIKCYPKNYILNLCGKKLLFTHFAWQGHQMADAIFKIEEKDFDYCFYGHIHSYKTETVEGVNYTSVGSLGLKEYGMYAVIDDSNGNVKIEIKSIKMDVEKFLKTCKKLNYPAWNRLVCYNFDNASEKGKNVKLILSGINYIEYYIYNTKEDDILIFVEKNIKNAKKLIKNIKKSHKNRIILQKGSIFNKKFLRKIFKNYPIECVYNVENSGIDLSILISVMKEFGVKKIVKDCKKEDVFNTDNNLIQILDLYNQTGDK